MRPSKEEVQERERLAKSGLKRCSVRSGCGLVKSIDEFGADKSKWDNKRLLCLVCNRKKSNQYYEENREAKRAYARQYHLDNTEARNAYARQRYLDNPEAKRAYARQYYLENIEEKREYSRTYGRTYYVNKQQEDPMYFRLKEAKSRAKKAGVEWKNISSTELLSHWEQRDITIDTCHYCKQTIDEGELEIDHGIPICRGGGHTLDNLFPSHRRCNISKRDKTVEEYLEHLKQVV